MNDANREAGAAATGYRVLARKYRPADFTALIGQEPMVRTLTNAFSSGRIAQAWMLTGVRGVGKTTTARILARALNYKTDTIDQPTVDLAVMGEHCKPIMEGRHVDVVEMDAASHTGIDDIRDIIEQVRYAPVSARYKVYIIDEVHMLSNQAFNGLLKTLEEPPPHVKFIFATTEIRKVPITVLSRCQRFDLRRVEAGVLVDHLRGIAQMEGIAVEDEAFAMIARAGEGSVRDSLSIMDQAIAHGAGAVTAQAVRDMLGLSDRARIVDLFTHVMGGDIPAALSEFRAQYDSGADPATILSDLAEFNHLVTRLRFVDSARNDAALSQEERERGADFAQRLSIRALSRSWQMLLKGISEVQGATRPASAAEMVIIRLAHAATLPTLDEALKMVESGEAQTAPRPSDGARGTAGGAQPQAPTTQAVAAPRTPSGAPSGATMRLVERAPEPVAFQRPPEPELPPAPQVASIADLVAMAEARRDMRMKIALRRYVRPVRIQTGQIEISLTDDAPRSLPNELSVSLKEWTGRHWVVSLSRENGGPTLAEIEEERRESVLSDARSDPAVAAILSTFPGARIIDVRIPDAVAETDDAAPEIPVEPADDDEF